MKYAIISAQGKQYRVTEGQTLTIDRLVGKENETMTFGDVMMVVDGENRTLGMPLIEGAKVEAKVLAHIRGPKIRVAKFKAKSRYRRVTGHRQEQSQVLISKIS